jgi:hypothetical protein
MISYGELVNYCVAEPGSQYVWRYRSDPLLGESLDLRVDMK